ncbi:MAG: glycosyltransferase family 4 protein [Bacillota bacterium]
MVKMIKAASSVLKKHKVTLVTLFCIVLGLIIVLHLSSSSKTKMNLKINEKGNQASSGLLPTIFSTGKQSPITYKAKVADAPVLGRQTANELDFHMMVAQLEQPLAAESKAPARRQTLLYALVVGAICLLLSIAFCSILMFFRCRPISKTETAPYNILHLLSTNRLSGAERIVQLITRHLNSSRFHSIITCGGDPLREVYKADGHPVEVMDVRFPTPSNIFRLRGILKYRHVHLIHAHDHRASLLAWMSSRFLLRRIPMISHIHNANPWLKQWHPFKLVDLVMRNRYNISIACSETVKEYYLRHNFTLKPTKVVTVTNGIEINDYGKVNRDAVAQNTGLPTQRFVFGTVGRLDEQKGIDLLLHAFREVANRLENVSLVIVGTGPDEQVLKKTARQLGINEHVVFTGYREDVHELMQVMDVFVLASRWEGLPMVLMEAMALGIPVIASDVGGVRELVRPGETGLLVAAKDTADLAAKMCYLYRDRELAAELARAGAALVCENHNMARQVQKIEDIYNILLSRKSSRKSAFLHS